MIDFSLEIAVPPTQTTSAFTVRVTRAEDSLQLAEVELKKEKGRVSFATFRLADPSLVMFNRLPDPAFTDIPIQFYLSEPGKTGIQVPVFDGKITNLKVNGGGGLTTLTIVAKDKSIDARRTAAFKTYKNKSPLDIVKAIAADYQLDVDTSDVPNALQLAQQTFAIGMAPGHQDALSDWDHMYRVMAAAGLTMHTKGKKIIVQQTSTAVYPTTFRPRDGKVINWDFSLNYVKSPGGLGNVSNPVPLDHTGTDKAVSGAAAAEAAKIKGGAAHTHRVPQGSPNTKNRGAHSEDKSAAKWSNLVTQRRGRKDEGSLTMNPTPGVELIHLVNLDGWSGKIDGHWEVISVRHVVVPSDAGSTTSLSLARGTGGSAKQAGTTAFDYGALK